MPRRSRLRRRDPGHSALIPKIEAGQPWERPEHDLDIDLKLYELLTGFDHFGLGFSDLAEARAAWDLVREPFLAGHVERRPGTRPWAWWAFEAPEPRRMLEGSPGRISPVAETWFGMPTAHACEYESERAYLWRLELLEPGDLDAQVIGREMPDSGTQYALDVVAGNAPACNAIRWACQRHLDDLEEGWRRGFFYDRRAAAYRLAFSSFVRFYQGPAGHVFKPQPWQCFRTGCLWGWMTAEDWRRFSQSFLFLPRKSGKTFMGAEDLLFSLIADGEDAPEVYAVATKRDQAAKCIKDAIGIRERSPVIRQVTRSARRTIVGPKWVACDHTGGFASTMTSSADAELGNNISFCVVDEAAVHPDDSNARQARDSMGGRGQQRAGDIGTGGGPMLSIITSAGTMKEAYGGQVYDLAHGILDPDDERKLDSFFAFVAELDDVFDGDAQMVASAREDLEIDRDGQKVTIPARWKDLDAWREAIPNLGVAKSERDLQDLVDAAISDPGKVPDLLIFHFNVWEASSEAWLPWNHWIRCQDAGVNAIAWRREKLKTLRGESCYLGLDFADRYDMNAAAAIFPHVEPRPVVLVWYWIPEENLRARVRRDHVPYDRWEKSGFLATTPGRDTDLDWIVGDIVGTGDSIEGSLMDRFDIVGVWLDPWRAKEAKKKLEAAGLECHIVRQSMTHLAEPSAKLKGWVRSEAFDHGGNAVLSWNAANAVPVRRPDGSEMPDKGRSERKRIDGLSALNNAMRGYIDHEEARYDAWDALAELDEEEGAESA